MYRLAIQIHYWSADVERLLRHYVETLDFELVHRQPAEPPAEFCILRLGDAQIMIGSDPAGLVALGRSDRGVLEAAAARIGRPGAVSVYIGVDEIDAYHDRVLGNGAEVVEPIWNAPWGNRQFTVQDLDGNLTTFFGMEPAG